MNSIPTIPPAASAQELDAPHPQAADLTIAAHLLLPGLHDARSRLDAAIHVLTRLAQQPPSRVPESYVAMDAKIRRMLAEARRSASPR